MFKANENVILKANENIYSLISSSGGQGKAHDIDRTFHAVVQSRCSSGSVGYKGNPELDYPKKGLYKL